MRGYTLIEIMVVVAILGLLAAVVVQGLLPNSQRAKRDIGKIRLANVGQALMMYRFRENRWPETLAELTERRGGQPPYIKDINDPWQQPIRLERSGVECTLRSIGPDGEANTEDDLVWRPE